MWNGVPYVRADRIGWALNPDTVPSGVLLRHRTSSKYAASILRHGLLPGGHFVAQEPGATGTGESRTAAESRK